MPLTESFTILSVFVAFVMVGLAIGFLPQLFLWIWYTIVFGALFGIVAAAIARRRGTAAG